MPELNWIGKEDVLSHHNEIPFRLLKADPNLSIGSNSENLIIQGDNLLALKALLPYYEGRIKCIYIDPPYNTGNENWKYNDNVNSPIIKKWLNEVVKKDLLDRESRWLCMMYPRLKLLYQLLADDGVIFISIDDLEIHNLLLICFEIFGGKQYVATLTWEKKKKGSHLHDWITNIKEYVIVFCKNELAFKGLIGQIVTEKETYPCINPGNTVSVRRIPKGVKSNYRDKNVLLNEGDIISVGNMSLKLLSPLKIVNGILSEDVTIESEWRYGQDKIDEYAKTNELYFTRDLYLRREVVTPRYKKLKDLLPRVDNEHLLELKTALIDILLTSGEQERIDNLKNEINEIENTGIYNFDHNNLHASGWGSNEDGDEENREIFGEKKMEFPKPSKFIAKLISSFRDKEAIVLDCFAGTGTTAHAVLQLNKKDNGSRKFILVEIEDTICRDITAERVKRVAQGYTNSKGESVEGLGGDFQYCTLGEELKTKTGEISDAVIQYPDLAHLVWFQETKTIWKQLTPNGELPSFLGKHNGVSYYLFFNGIMGDTDRNRANVLTPDIFKKLTRTKNPKVVFAEQTLVNKTKLKKSNIQFKQIPQDIRTK